MCITCQLIFLINVFSLSLCIELKEKFQKKLVTLHNWELWTFNLIRSEATYWCSTIHRCNTYILDIITWLAFFHQMFVKEFQTLKYSIFMLMIFPVRYQMFGMIAKSWKICNYLPIILTKDVYQLTLENWPSFSFCISQTTTWRVRYICRCSKCVYLLFL